MPAGADAAAAAAAGRLPLSAPPSHSTACACLGLPPSADMASPEALGLFIRTPPLSGLALGH